MTRDCQTKFQASDRGNVELPQRALKILDDLRDRAQSQLDDSASVQRALEVAEGRSAKHRELKQELAPLTRLVRSSVRGAFGAPRRDVALAFAAVLYVNSPVDAIPDRLPGGLKDDLAVVRWVAEKLGDTLGSYADWERALNTSGAKPSGVSRDRKGAGGLQTLAVREIGAPESSLFSRVPGPHPHAPSIALGPGLAAGLATASSLQPGQVLQIVGSSHLLEGLASGSLELVHSGAGHLGTLRDVGSKHWAGHLRFGDQPQSAGVPGPLAAFQVASAVTLQYYLARIDRQLGDIADTCQRLVQSRADDRMAEIEKARARCASVERALSESGDVGATDAHLLNLAYDALEKVYLALVESAKRFAADVESVPPLERKRKELAELLETAAGAQLVDTQLLLYAAVVRHRILGLQVHLYANDGEARARQAVEEAADREGDALATLDRVAAAYATLQVPKSVLEERWGVRGGPEKELAGFRAASDPLVASLHAAPSALPPYVPDESFLMEMRLSDEGRVEVEYAELREPAVTV